jgi:ferredoxin
MMRCVGCIACTGEKRNAYKGNPEGKRLFGSLGVDGRMAKSIPDYWDYWAWTGFVKL